MILKGDSLFIPLKDKSVDCVVTSPPYWGLRKYEIPDLIWDGVFECEHEWGNELLGRRSRSENDIVDMNSKEATKSASAFNSTGGNFCLKCNAWKGQLGLECVSFDTEILTMGGWKSYEQIKEGEDAATFNLENGKIEYHPIEKIFIKNYSGEMIRIKNFHVDMLLTPNHRVLCKNRCHSGKNTYYTNWDYVFAKEIKIKQGLIIPTSFELDNTCRISIGEDLAELIGWILTDGSFANVGNRITIYQSKKEGIERIEYLLNKLDITYGVHKRKEKTNYSDNPKERYYFRFSGVMAKNIRGLIGDKKNPSNKLLFLKENELRRLFDGIFYGDGSGQSIYGKPPSFRNWLQRLCFHLGLRTLWNENKTSIEFSNNNSTEISRKNKRKPNDKEYGITKIDYRGKVWCVKTKNSNFVARRNKQIFITGNSSFELYISHLLQIFDEVKRVLKPEGTCFVNLGDSYGGSGGCHKEYHKNDTGFQGKGGPQKGGIGNLMLPKSLCQIPYRFSIEMVNKGWILRNLIVWKKSNAMPSSCKDRFTVDFEPVFFFSKSRKYWFEQQFEDFKGERWGGDDYIIDGNEVKQIEGLGRNRSVRPNPKGRNKRCVWEIPTKPYKGSHFAVFPPALVEPMIRAGCPKGGVVLDPFGGTGTVALVAKKLDRIGISLDLGYEDLAKKRLNAGG